MPELVLQNIWKNQLYLWNTSQIDYLELYKESIWLINS